jgi:hypothetical protein
LWPGWLAAAALGAALRFPYLDGGLPGLPGPDEQAVVRRANGVLDGHLPDLYDWPTGTVFLQAAVMRVDELLGGVVDPFTLGRIVVAIVGTALVVLTGWLAAEVAPAARRRWVSWGAAGLVAVAYVAVRMSRTIHPEIVQALAVVASLGFGVRYDRTGRRRDLVCAGLLAGAAAGVKYLGVLALVVPVLSILTRADNGPGGRPRALLVALGTSVGAFLLLVPGMFVHPAVVGAGINGQLTHQERGHPGFDGGGPSWGFHLTQSLPGSWGWPITVLGLAGLALAAWRGTRQQRLLAAFVGLSFAVIGASSLEFPAYALLLLPAFAVFAVLAVDRLVRAIGAVPSLVVAAVVVATLAPTVAHDVQLVRAASVADTRARSAELLAELDDDHPIVEERYTDLVGRRSYLGALGEHPEVLECDCLVVISSYIEERYRAEPERYAKELRVYDELRERGEVVAVIRGDHDLSYRWDHIPQWGADELPVIGSSDELGPTITVIDLRS